MSMTVASADRRPVEARRSTRSTIAVVSRQCFMGRLRAVVLYIIDAPEKRCQ
jgi:hypothetical protein